VAGTLPAHAEAWIDRTLAPRQTLIRVLDTDVIIGIRPFAGRKPLVGAATPADA
jgi:hypothetical protein